jgi:hypothetical protein
MAIFCPIAVARKKSQAPLLGTLPRKMGTLSIGLDALEIVSTEKVAVAGR